MLTCNQVLHKLEVALKELELWRVGARRWGLNDFDREKYWELLSDAMNVTNAEVLDNYTPVFCNPPDGYTMGADPTVHQFPGTNLPANVVSEPLVATQDAFEALLDEVTWFRTLMPYLQVQANREPDEYMDIVLDLVYAMAETDKHDLPLPEIL